jgi:hypothetical protein
MISLLLISRICSQRKIIAMASVERVEKRGSAATVRVSAYRHFETQDPAWVAARVPPRFKAFEQPQENRILTNRRLAIFVAKEKEDVCGIPAQMAVHRAPI